MRYDKHRGKPAAVHSPERAELETGNPAGSRVAEFSDLPEFQSVNSLHPTSTAEESTVSVTFPGFRHWLPKIQRQFQHP